MGDKETTRADTPSEAMRNPKGLRGYSASLHQAALAIWDFTPPVLTAEPESAAKAPSPILSRPQGEA